MRNLSLKIDLSLTPPINKDSERLNLSYLKLLIIPLS